MRSRRARGNPYVYRSASVYDKAIASPMKVSAYLGRLTQEAGLIPKGMQDARLPRPPPTIRECGNAALLATEFRDLLPAL